MLEGWRGALKAAAGDVAGMRSHLERAVQLATEQGLAAARCEALAALALGAARFGAEGKDEELLALAESSANEVKTLRESLPGHPPWGAQADAALARVALARGAGEEAVRSALSAVNALETALQEDLHPEIVEPVADVVMAAGSPEEKEAIRFFLRLFLSLAAQRTMDQDVRARWFRGPVGRRLVELAGSMDGIALQAAKDEMRPVIGEADTDLLRLLTQGLTNREIAERLGEDEAAVSGRLAEMFARIGTPSRSEATAFAFRERVV
jgi:DNA-binding NarL/FixJ family response regulator